MERFLTVLDWRSGDNDTDYWLQCRVSGLLDAYVKLL